MKGVRLFVGLGNPGLEYEATRHNVGYWFVKQLADEFQARFKVEKKFHGFFCQINISQSALYLLQPTTFMNHSGRAVRALMQFYHFTPDQIVVIHDDLDLPNGDMRLKKGGGDGGHNGLKDITAMLGSNEYLRLRIGIDHPGSREKVHSYVLSAPTRAQKEELLIGIDQAQKIVPLLIEGQIDKAMKALNTK
jgi:PTH1 family peptidyl-tRNA hydrolase